MSQMKMLVLEETSRACQLLHRTVRRHLVRLTPQGSQPSRSWARARARPAASSLQAMVGGQSLIYPLRPRGRRRMNRPSGRTVIPLRRRWKPGQGSEAGRSTAELRAGAGGGCGRPGIAGGGISGDAKRRGHVEQNIRLESMRPASCAKRPDSDRRWPSQARRAGKAVGRLGCRGGCEDEPVRPEVGTTSAQEHRMS